MLKRVLYLLVAAAALSATGCIVSLTELVEVDLGGNIDFNNGLVKETVNLADYDVDLSAIDDVDKMDLDAVLRNDLATADNIDVYVSANSSYTTRAAVEAAGDVLPVLLNYTPPAGPGAVDTLTVPEARTLLQFSNEANWNAIKALLSTGSFTVYMTSTGNTAQGEVLQATLYLYLTGNL